MCDSCFLKIWCNVVEDLQHICWMGAAGPKAWTAPPPYWILRGGCLGLRPGWPPTILDKTSLKIQHVCQRGYSGLRLGAPPFCIKSAGAAEAGGPLRPAIPDPPPHHPHLTLSYDLSCHEMIWWGGGASAFTLSQRILVFSAVQFVTPCCGMLANQRPI